MKIRHLALAGTAALAISGAAIGEGDRQAQGMSSEQQQRGGMNQSMNSDTLRQAQQALNDKGHNAGPVDGKWGPQTQQGVKDFQQAQGIQATGQLDQRTLAALGIQRGSSAGSGQRTEPGSTAAPKSEGGASAGSSTPPQMKQDESRDQQRQQPKLEESTQGQSKSY